MPITPSATKEMNTADGLTLRSGETGRSDADKRSTAVNPPTSNLTEESRPPSRRACSPPPGPPGVKRTNSDPETYVQKVGGAFEDIDDPINVICNSDSAGSGSGGPSSHSENDDKKTPRKSSRSDEDEDVTANKEEAGDDDDDGDAQAETKTIGPPAKPDISRDLEVAEQLALQADESNNLKRRRLREHKTPPILDTIDNVIPPGNSQQQPGRPQ